MFRRLLATAALFGAVASPAAALDFKAADFERLLTVRFAHLWPDAKVRLTPGFCKPTACWYGIGDKIKLRAYSLTGETVDDISATLDADADANLQNAFLGACMVILNIADPGIKGDGGLALAAKLAKTSEREVSIPHGKYDLVGEKAPDGRTCTVFPK